MHFQVSSVSHFRQVGGLSLKSFHSLTVTVKAATVVAPKTSSFYLHIFKVQITEKRIQIGGKQPFDLYLVTISVFLSEQVPFPDKDLTVKSNIICDNKILLVGLSDGSLYNISWKGEGFGTKKCAKWL